MRWRPPYVSHGSASADPVRDVAFSFVSDALNQVLVNYDRERTAGPCAARLASRVVDALAHGLRWFIPQERDCQWGRAKPASMTLRP
jgi:hypothetical protein